MPQSEELLAGRSEQEFYRDLCVDLQAEWEGRKTPKGRDKSLPWFCVTHCPSCDLVGYTYQKFPMGMRFRCREQLYRKGEGVMTCEAVLTPLEPIGMTEKEMWTLYDTWREKYG